MMSLLETYTLPIILEPVLLKNTLLQIYNLIHTYRKTPFTIIICSYILLGYNHVFLDNLINEQTFIKTYVLFGILEILERLLSTVIEDIRSNFSDILPPFYLLGNFWEGTKESKSEIDNGDDKISDSHDSIETTEIETKIPIIKNKPFNTDFNEISTKNQHADFKKGMNMSTKLSGFDLTKSFSLWAFYALLSILQAIVINTQFVIIHQSMTDSNNFFEFLIANQFFDLRAVFFSDPKKEVILDMLNGDVRKRYCLLIFSILSTVNCILGRNTQNFYNLLIPVFVLLSKSLIDCVKHVFMFRRSTVRRSLYRNFVAQKDNTIGYNIVILTFIFYMVNIHNYGFIKKYDFFDE